MKTRKSCSGYWTCSTYLCMYLFLEVGIVKQFWGQWHVMDYLVFLPWGSNKNVPCCAGVHDWSPVRSGNVLRPNMIKHCFVLSGQTVSNVFEWTKCFTVFDQMFVIIQILSNTIKQGVQHENGWTPNNVWSFLVTEHFPFGRGFTPRTHTFCVVYANF